MQSQSYFILLPLFLATTISAALAIIAWRQKPSTLTRSFAMLMTVIAFWSLAYTFEVAAGTYETKLFWARIQYVGIVAVPPMWLIFSLAYADRKDWLKSRTYALLAIDPVIILTLVWSNDSHHLIWLQTNFINSSLPLVYLYGTFFWIHAAYTYSLLLLGSLLLIHTVMRSSVIHRGQALALFIGLLAPWLANLVYLADVNPFPLLDLTPFAFAITGLAVGWGLLRHHLLDIVPVARNAVVESMRDAVIVIDPQNRVIDLNPVALQASSYKNGSFVGKTIEEVFPNWHPLIDQFKFDKEFHDRAQVNDGNEQRILDIKIAPLQSRAGQLSSRVVMISDITDWVKSEEALAISEKSYQDLYTSMNEGLALHELVYNQSGEAVDYTILDVNPAFEKIIGISRAEALGCRASVLYGTNEPPFLDTYARVIESNEPFSFEEWFEPFEKYFRISVFSPRSDQFATVFTDITESKRAEEQSTLQTKIIEVTAILTAKFNTAASAEEVHNALWDGLHNLGFKYLSPYQKKGDRLVWDLDALDLPGWLLQDIPEVLVRFIGNRDLNIWVPLASDNIFARCYNTQEIITTENNYDILNPIHFGETSFEDLPAWVKQAALLMMKRLDVSIHRAFPLGKYGIIFLSNPSRVNMDQHSEWVEIILKQAEVALARTQATDALLESENRYRALFERTSDAVFILDLDMTYIGANQQAANMLGYKIQELIGMHVKEVVAPDEWPDMKEIEAQLRDGEIPPIYRRTLIKKDESRILTELAVAMAYDQNGKPSHFQYIVRDVTDRVMTQEKLSLQASALEAAANGILIIDKSGNILWTNPAVTSLSGYTQDEILGQHLDMFDSGEQNPDFYKHIMDTVCSGQVWQGQLNNARKDGSRYIEEMTVTPVKDSNGHINRFIAVKQDVTERAKTRELLEHLATHDATTNLPNRTLFNDRINHAIKQANRKKCKIGVLFFDLDNFKTVNDNFGHKAGDLLLLAVGQRLLTCVRESDTVARLGGDEFTILLENIKEKKDVERVAKQLLSSFSKPFSIQGAKINITFSIGISLYPDDGHTVEELLKKSDQAMYAVKHSGKNGYSFFSS